MRSRDSSVRIVTKLGAGRQQLRIWFLAAAASLRPCVQTACGAHRAPSTTDIVVAFSEGKAVGL